MARHRKRIRNPLALAAVLPVPDEGMASGNERKALGLFPSRVNAQGLSRRPISGDATAL
jgi:hypothetical protein